MRPFGLVTFLLVNVLVNGQDQFLREVSNPSGPSVSILRGGFLNNGGSTNGLEQNIPQEERYVLDDQQGQGLPLQVSLDSPIPENGGSNNPFTNGEAGFGLRLDQARPSAAQSPQPQQPQTPQLQPQNTAGVAITPQLQPQLIQQPFPIFQQTPLSLPQLPAGQLYVDTYGRQVILPQAPPTQPPTTPAPPPPPPPPPPTPPAPNVTVQKHAIVDNYGRQLGEYETHAIVPGAPILHQQFIQPGAFPVFHPAQFAVPAAAQVPQAVPVAHAAVPVAPAVQVAPVAQTATVEAPAIAENVVAPPPLTFQTYAVPAVRKVGNLLVPYAKKVTYAKTQGVGVVYPPIVQAPAVVKSSHRTLLSPVPDKLLTPAAAVVNEVHVAHPAASAAGVVNEVQVVHPEGQILHHFPIAAHHPFIVQQPQQVLFHHPHVAVPVEHHLTHVHQPVAVAAPAVPVIEHHHVPVAQQVVHQVAHPVVHHHPLNQLVHVDHHPPVVAAAPAPVLLKKHVAAVAPVIEKAIIPPFTLIQQPVLPKVLFQRHIFNVKHGSDPIIYQDLCTVYPFQKNLRACVLKKAVLPELHHPDIRTINVEEQHTFLPHTDQTRVSGGSAILAPVPLPMVVVTRNPPKSIQETIKRESAKSREAAVAAAAASESSTTVQPETAESRDTVTTKSKSRRRAKSSSSNNEKDFKLV